MDKAIKEEIRNEYAKAWESQDMIDFCTNKVKFADRLSNGGLLIIEKQSIETHFCFGESGYDYDDAQRMASHARTSEDYFKHENLVGLDDAVLVLQGEQENCFDFYMQNATPYLIRESYYGETSPLNLYKIRMHRDSIYDFTKKENLIPLNDEDRQTAIALYQQMRDDMNRRLDNYLKKYGMKNIHSWTYWRDA